MEKGYFGADYYPEHWPESRWETDAALMRDMGLKVVRMGEFSWAKFEPSQGEFDFAWFDRAVQILNRHGIKTIIGTPTATPPAWIIEQHPDILPVDSQGRVRGFGGRHHDCQSNAAYRSHIKRLVTAMAKHYSGMDGVIGWQIDNELGNSHQDLCHCQSCRTSFQEWLSQKYTTIENLNKAWGTAFWSQTYNGFSQIPTPMILPPAKGHNPSHALDWKRFCSDLICDFQRFQIDILREFCPDHFITHNFMGFADKVDYFDLAEDLDFISHDQYPMGFYHSNPPWKSPAELSAALDLMRATKNKPFWIMEQQSGPAGWTTISRTPRPGQLRLWTAHSIAHGADSVVYFRWRTCAFGTEEYWHGILPHSGRPGSRYAELKKAVSDLKPVLQEIQGAMPAPEVAIVYNYDQKWAFDLQPHHPELAYISQVLGYYQAFYDNNIPVDFITGKEDLGKYKLIIAPLQFIDQPGLAERLEAYVRQGGNALVTMRSGVKNHENVCFTESELPGPFSRLLGLEILDYDCLRENTVEFIWTAESAASGQGTKWADIITPKGAKVLAEYAGEYYEGTPAATENEYGSGKAFYVATEMDSDSLKTMVRILGKAASLNYPAETAPGVELAYRYGKKDVYLFALNHTSEEKSLTLDDSWNLLLGSNELAPYDFAVFKKKLT